MTIGPCNTSGSGSAWNGSEMGEGQITSFTIQTPCATNLPGCTIVKATASASGTTLGRSH